MKPGSTVLPRASSSSAPAPTASRTSRSSPTAAILPSRTPTAWAVGRRSSTVHTFALRITRSIVGVADRTRGPPSTRGAAAIVRPMSTPLILDVDTGVDDMVALLFAVASPEVELVGATCVTGNVHVDMVTRNTSLVLELAGAGDVEIARGASEPLNGGWQPFPVVHGPEGLGAYVPGHHAKAISARSAATLIAQEACRRPGEMTLIATGPLTNVALALELEPSLPALLGGFALMGGAYRAGGNVTPRAEANVWMDPEAAARVFDAWSAAPPERLPRCVGLDVTERVRMTHADIETVCSPAPASPLARLIAESVPHYIDFYAA